MRTTGSVSTITYTTTVTASVSLVSLARGVKWVSHMTHDTHMHDTHRYMHKYQIPTHMQRVHSDTNAFYCRCVIQYAALGMQYKQHSIQVSKKGSRMTVCLMCGYKRFRVSTPG